MCGLVGMMGNFYLKHEKMMKLMLIFDTLRGPHSTGLAAVDKDRDIDVVRKTVPGWDFVEDPIIDRLMTATDKVWLGHNRFATVGKINRLNAHPFVVDNNEGEPMLVGAHNGTLSNRGQAIDNAYNFGTDSEGLYNMIYANGIEETISRCEGAWALSWYDKEEDAVFFLRNKERPLYMCYVKNSTNKTDDTIAWASESWMLEVAAERSELEISQVFYFEEDFLHWFKVPKKVGDKIVMGKGKEAIRGKPVAPFQTGGTGYGAEKNTYKWIGEKRYRWDTQERKWIRTVWAKEPGKHTHNWVDLPEEEETAQEAAKARQTTQKTQQEIEEQRARGQETTSGRGRTSLTVVSPTTDGSKNNSSSKATLRELPMGSSSQQDNERFSTEQEDDPNLMTPSQTSGSSRKVLRPSNFKVKGFEGELLPPAEAKKIMDKGCQWCGDPISHSSGIPDQAVVWLTPTAVCCISCERDTHGKPDDYTGLWDGEIEKVKKGEAKIKPGGELVLVASGLTQDEIEEAIKSRDAQESSRVNRQRRKKGAK